VQGPFRFRRAVPAGRQSLAVLFVTVFIDLMGFGIVIPLLPLYAERMQATAFEAGALLAVYSLMQLLFAPLWGRLSDRIGRRPVLLASLSGSAASYFLLAVAGSLPALFAARVVAGIAGANIPVAQAYIADVTSGPQRTRGMGLIGAAFGLGMVIGPALGGGLLLLGPRMPELFAAALCLANVVVAALRLPESRPPTVDPAGSFRHPLAPAVLRVALRRPGVPALLAVFFLVTLGFAVLEGTFSLTATHRHGYPPARVAGLWLYMGVVAVVIQGWLVGRLARRVPERALVAVGAACLGVGLAAVPWAEPGPELLLALGLVIAGQGLAAPSIASLLSGSGEAAQGMVLGVSQSLSAAARVVGPAGGGFVLHHLGPGATYLGAAVGAAAALLVALPAVRPAPARTAVPGPSGAP
jgi:MFS transporter, DHA1 family, tetracycline resistance protein